MNDKYILRVTAGPGYDPAQHVEVLVNQPQPTYIVGDYASIELNVRIKGYNGLPLNSPATSPYFDVEPHKYNQDQYSISLRFTPKGDNISGSDLQFGNDFDRPIRDRLPPGFNTAMGIVKWWIDPGLEGDAYADRPYLYGPALSSFNALHIGAVSHDEMRGGIWVEEGGVGSVREKYGMPMDGKSRMRWALSDDNKENWIWEAGTTYSLDFYNAYIDFPNLALRLPGFQLHVMNFLDRREPQTGKYSHTLRYVLRNKRTGECFLAICFTLYLKSDVNEYGEIDKNVVDRETVIVDG